jgi:type IV secretion system protein VirB6
MGSCDTTIAANALARDVLASADCMITTHSAQGYAALLAPTGTFVTALTIGLTIYVAAIGYRLILGLSGLTLAETVPHFIKLGVVLALATSWASYQTVVFNLLFHGPQELADAIVRQAAGTRAAGQGDVLMALQSVFDRLTDAANDAWAQVVPTDIAAMPVTPAPVDAAVVPAAPALPFAFGAPQFIAGLLWLSALVMMAASVGVLLVARIVLALLLLFGPVFVCFALFQATRGVFEGWLRVTVKFALVPLFATPLIAVAVVLLASISAGLGDAPIESVRDSPVFLILLVVMVFAAVMTQAARLGGSIAGGIRLPRGANAAAAGSVNPSLVLPGASSASAADRAAAPNRADAIVRAISDGRHMGIPGSVGTAPGATPATRSITISAGATPVVPDNSNRLGQGYRRLAVASSQLPRI